MASERFLIDARLISIMGREDVQKSIAAIIEADICRLPYEDMLVEFMAEPPVWRMVLLRQRLDHIEAEAAYVNGNHMAGVLDQPATVRVRDNALAIEGCSDQSAASAIAFAAAIAILLLNTRGIEKERVVSTRLNRKRERKGKRPVPKYTHVRVGHIYDRDGRRQGLSKTGVKQPVHFRAGYTRTVWYGPEKSLSRIDYVPPCLVNFRGEMPAPKRRKDTAPVKERDYLGFIAELPCIIQRTHPVEVAHLSFAEPAYGHFGRGKARKASDRWCLPLDARLHAAQHSGSEIQFWARHGIDPHLACLVLYGLFNERDRAQHRKERMMGTVSDADEAIGNLGVENLRELSALAWFCDCMPDGKYALIHSSRRKSYEAGGDLHALVTLGCVKVLKSTFCECHGKRKPAVKMEQFGRRVLRRTIWTDIEGRQTGDAPEPGMSMRDYFAAHALPQAVLDYGEPSSAISAGQRRDRGNPVVPYATAATGTREEIIARQAYRYADAMLAVRETDNG
ncbi:unnamed protein product [Effrenium voratum]|uniref:Uncharacterized protein n=1 Tax=Effrenium voratum TaxID=2562239 RepID=A0AA36N6Z0_9DINO|nr:unnamed protein product [Effrenium voratum]